MYTHIENRFNDIALKQLQIYNPNDFFDFDLISRKLDFKIKYSKKVNSCYLILNHKSISANYVVLNDIPLSPCKQQFKEFYHEVAHHLLHAHNSPENELQCNICWLFLIIPKSILKSVLKENCFDFDISGLADYFNVNIDDMTIRLEHFNENNLYPIDWSSVKDSTFQINSIGDFNINNKILETK